jgi:aspartyl protease family protein
MSKINKYINCYSLVLAIALSLACFQVIAAEDINTYPEASKTPEFTIYADPNGHYRGTVLINNIPFPFLIDTGATSVAIPSQIAARAGLILGKTVLSDTANGTVYGRLTKLDRLKVGNVTFSGAEASVLTGLNEVLIGMNILKYFHMSHSLNKLTLKLVNDAEFSAIRRAALATNNARSSISIKAPVTKWKKTVECDKDGLNCKTSYR